MSDCLPCDINELARQHVERGTNDLAEIASMMAESLADLVLLAPDQDRANLVAHSCGFSIRPDVSGKERRVRGRLQRDPLGAMHLKGLAPPLTSLCRMASRHRFRLSVTPLSFSVGPLGND